MQYDCLTSPRFSQLDATLTKDFAVTERVRLELKMAAYNATNSLNRQGRTRISTALSSGRRCFRARRHQLRCWNQELGNITGRQVELGLKIRF